MEKRGMSAGAAKRDTCFYGVIIAKTCKARRSHKGNERMAAKPDAASGG
jgi:hypothetical protein